MRSQRTGIRRTVTAFAVALALLSLLPAAGAAKGRPVKGLVRIGLLPQPPQETVIQGQVVQVDARRGKLFYTYLNDIDGRATWLVEYDLRSAIPRFVRSGRVAAANEIPAS
ncbi:MAG TPA: hypothetical protein VHJ76_00995, partial [Actinomycetota bacterium]|nr:hypothetical protein [Actinomycetota bacterium]